MEHDADRGTEEDVEFFGVKLKVSNPRLAALLNSDVNEEVKVIGRRARDVFAVDGREIDRDDSVEVDLGSDDEDLSDDDEDGPPL